MIRHIPVPTCAQCPYRQLHYGNHECSKFNFQVLPTQAIMNGKSTPIPDWCPLPPHPSFAQEGGAA